jgi:hypothetical protein
MSRVQSAMVQLGTTAPAFRLLNVMTSEIVSREDIFNAGSAKKHGLLIMFLCVHCPYVKHVEQELARMGHDYFGEAGEGPITIAAIQSNDVEQYPEDGPDQMRAQALRLGWHFPYLLDSTQEVAHAYEAACTPDFFLFDGQMRLAYRGQLDSSRPRRKDFGNDEPVTGRDLRAAMDALISGKTPETEQLSSIGCNIKWRESSTSGIIR